MQGRHTLGQLLRAGSPWPTSVIAACGKDIDGRALKMGFGPVTLHRDPGEPTVKQGQGEQRLASEDGPSHHLQGPRGKHSESDAGEQGRDGQNSDHKRGPELAPFCQMPQHQMTTRPRPGRLDIQSVTPASALLAKEAACSRARENALRDFRSHLPDLRAGTNKRIMSARSTTRIATTASDQSQAFRDTPRLEATLPPVSRTRCSSSCQPTATQGGRRPCVPSFPRVKKRQQTSPIRSHWRAHGRGARLPIRLSHDRTARQATTAARGRGVRPGVKERELLLRNGQSR